MRHTCKKHSGCSVPVRVFKVTCLSSNYVGAGAEALQTEDEECDNVCVTQMQVTCMVRKSTSLHGLHQRYKIARHCTTRTQHRVTIVVNRSVNQTLNSYVRRCIIFTDFCLCTYLPMCMSTFSNPYRLDVKTDTGICTTCLVSYVRTYIETCLGPVKL